MRSRLSRRARLLISLVVAVPLLIVLAVAPSTTRQHAATGDAPEEQRVPDSAVERETLSSGNIEQTAQLPKQPPFDGQESWGTDLAFQGGLAYIGNYDGFSVVDISEPDDPTPVAQVHCPGGQGDISVSGDRLYLSVDYPHTDNTCQGEETTEADPGGWEGIRVFDISDPARPQYVSAVPTACGSHTHTLVPGKDGSTDYLYVSSYGPAEEFPNCQPPHDRISIVEVPHDDPGAAELVDAPVLFPGGGNAGESASRETTGCHDITAFPDKDIAAGACMGDGILLDISERDHPRVIQRTRDDRNFEFWHSATFNNSGDRIVFTDELGGGTAATCNEQVGPKRGANGIYRLAGSGQDARLEFVSYFKIPRHQSETENCVAHNGSLVPVPGRDIMVQAWYQGGVSVWEFTDPRNPREIAHFDRVPYDSDELQTAGSWSAYYYNGRIYSSGIQEGLDVLELDDPRTDPAEDVTYDQFNPQTQPVY